MRIVNIIQRYEPAVGGSETWCREVCRFLASRGHDVKVLTFDVNKEEEFWRDPPDEDRRVAMGRLFIDQRVVVRRYRRSIPIFTLYHVFYKRILDHLCRIYFYGPHSAEMYAKMWREIKDADVVFLHTLPYPHNFVALGLAKYFKKKTLIVPHFHPGHSAYERPSEYWLMRKCDVVVADSEYEKDYIGKHGVPEERFFVPGVGIHPREYIPSNLEQFRERLQKHYGLCQGESVLTFLGRKMPDKGVDHLIAAVRHLRSKMPLKLFLAGPSFEWFRKLYDGLPAEERKFIIDLGVLSHQDKVDLLHVSDLLLLPSKFEAFGIVFLESWICGVPVLGTTQGAMPSIIGDEGFVCEYGNVEDLESKILLAFKDRKSLKERGTRGKAKVLERYTWDAVGLKAEQAVKAAYGRRKVLVCTNAYPPNFIGGAELIAHYQSKALQRRGCEVTIFAGDPNVRAERHSMQEDTYDGLTVHRVSLRPKDYSFEYVNFSHPQVEANFNKVLTSFSPDVVHFHNLVGLSVGLIHLAKKRGIKTVVTLHDHWGFCFKNTLLKREAEICSDYTKCAECRSSVSDDDGRSIPIRMRKDYLAMQLREVDTFITPSTYLAETYIGAGFPRDKFQVTWSGIDVARFSKIRRNRAGGTVRFTFIGYFGRHKGIHILLEALSLIGEKTRIRLNLVGEGDQEAVYRETVKRFGCENVVRFWGKMHNSRLEEVYAETDVIILPSIWPENQPVSVTEAMAAGIPVIASRIGGIPELIEDGKSGFLFEAGNPEQLAKRMGEFVAHPAKLEEFGKNAFAKIAEISFENQVARIIEAYDREDRVQPQRLRPERLVVCAGRSMDSCCTDGMEQIASEFVGGVRFVKQEWLQDDQLPEADLLWVLDESVRLEDVVLALQYKLPLLVPETNTELTEVCRQANCGLYYATAFEAVECIKSIIRDRPLQASLGENAFRLAYSG